MNRASVRPLAGVRVVEFCQIASGPYCGMLLADGGADVIKIEPPEGDAMRQWPPLNDGHSANFLALNRGKRSIILDLKTECDRDLARSLVLDADVLIENNRPGVMDKLGLGWKWFEPRKPSLVYCSISAFGQSGPRSREGGFDLTIQAVAGIMSVTGEPDGAPVKCGVPVSDFTAGLYAAFGITAQLNRVRQTGEGGHIDIGMFATTLAIASLQTSEYLATGRDPAKLGSAHPRNAPYQAYKASDGWFVMAAGNDRLWRAVCDAIRTPELVDDPRFGTTALRAANQAELNRILAPHFAGETVADWLSCIGKAGVPCAPINSYSSALTDVQAQHLELVESVPLPGGKTGRTVGGAIRINGQRSPVEVHAPGLGEHTDSIKATYAGKPAFRPG